jgi:hypothetical protein
MTLISRDIEEKIQKRLFQGKVVILYGARQVGKTTVVKKILKEYGDQGAYFNCEVQSVRKGLEEVEPERIRAFLGEKKLVVLDEAQKIPQIGLILKVLCDAYPEMQIIATGSSSFELADEVSEPLTGRNFTLTLYPLSMKEIAGSGGFSVADAKLEQVLRFGSYPEVFLLPEQKAMERLDELASDYLYKDVLLFDRMRKSELIRNLLELVALQLGQEVSYDELAQKLGVNRLTVVRYLDILEKSFVIFRLRAFSRNKRLEITKSVKIYFYDLGLRNSIVRNYNPTTLRTDKGALWENFCIVERMKANAEADRRPNGYFWRTYTKKEIDYVEEFAGKIVGYEFKWSGRKSFAPPKEFVDGYQATLEKIDTENYWKFLALKN